MQILRSALHSLFMWAGVDLVRLSSVRHVLGRRRRVLENLDVDLVFDVGANTGQYARELRRSGYKGRIVSIEPLPDAFEQLAARARDDPSWEVLNFALGAHEGALVMRVAGNSASSSALAASPELLKLEPRATQVATVTVPVRRFDDVLLTLAGPSRRPFLKLDVQGLEREVLDGAQESIARMVGLQIELAFRPMYAGAETALTMIGRLETLGFRLMGLELGLTDPQSGELIEADGIFVRAASSPDGSPNDAGS